MKILDKLRGLFQSKPEIIPQTGETWALSGSTKGPWPSPDQVRVKILDVKSGWVRYEMNPYLYNDERMKLSTFTYLYQKAE